MGTKMPTPAPDPRTKPTPEADKHDRHPMAVCLDIESIRARSGNVKSSDPLVLFLYHLMRDHLPTGVVADLCRESLQSQNTVYTNGWLANYARTLAAAIGQGSSNESETT